MAVVVPMQSDDYCCYGEAVDLQQSQKGDSLENPLKCVHHTSVAVTQAQQGKDW